MLCVGKEPEHLAGMCIEEKGKKLAEYVRSMNFNPVQEQTIYHHMGATITDACLQSGLSFKTVVYPRVLKLLTDFSDFKTTTEFIILMQTIPLPELINWKNERKLTLTKELTQMFYDNGVENEEQLSAWLESEENCNKLLNLKGIGPKTVDYLKMLSGHQAIPIDRHLMNFLKMAGVPADTYEEASLIYQEAAKVLGVSNYVIDRQVWEYMSKNSGPD